MNRRLRWFFGTVILIAIVALIIMKDIPVLFYPELPYVQFFAKCFFILLLAAFFCLYRVVMGPTAPDRVVAIDILGILIVGFCSILGVSTGRSWYIDIGIAWALQSFIATLALAKYLEGKDFDD